MKTFDLDEFDAAVDEACAKVARLEAINAALVKAGKSVLHDWQLHQSLADSMRELSAALNKATEKKP